MANTLLPPNATDLEKAVGAVLARLDSLPVPGSEFWNPDKCPVSFLPLLAWQLQVGKWNSSWTEATQRAVIKAALPVHRKRGTAGAVTDALAAVGVNGQLLEWFNQSPVGTPNTFVLKALVNDNVMPAQTIIDDARITQLLDVVNEAKRESQSYTLEIGAEYSGAAQFAAVSRTALMFKMQGEI
ncbi:phage tail protein I [Kordiimonas marina]|uniref:phage tail protein I n=1 Tax=Kordiimonas marina TaxID=2872312 RepID=UPI001FF6CDC5|nr:phage tail protein I [Kordiimonas marina]MCJ9428544.1 phage tail protein I [Kordiimonas marina]